MGLDTKVNQLNKVGGATYSKLKKLGIETAKDLIFYYPFRYEDFSNITPIAKLQPGMTTTVVGRLELIASRRSFRKKMVLIEGLVADKTGSVKVIWFNQPWIAKNLQAGDIISLAGKVAGDLFNVYLNSPEYEKAGSNSTHTARLVPIYSLTEGLTQKQLRFLIKNTITLADKIDDYLPLPILKEKHLISLAQALKKIHFPANKNEIDKARNRLAFDELFIIQLWSKLLKRDLASHKSYRIKFFEDETKEFVAELGFKLTDDQRKAAWEIITDLKSGSPMNRLVEGDVGSGKTLVAAIAAYNVSLNGLSTAFLAPTEILANQHFATLSKVLGKSIKLGLFTRSQRIIGDRAVAKKEFLKQCQKGEIDLIIGTHTLIQKDIAFNNLALVIVDEQHRFGVLQREELKKKSWSGQVSSKRPHFLSLSATPIPRSLALTVYGDLALSIIRQMPLGRKKIITRVVAPAKRLEAYQFIKEQVKAGRQVFVVCPLIDPSDNFGFKSATEEFEKLDKEIFLDLAIGLLHGKLKPAQKEQAMADFLSGRTKILVSTSVVEVGVDVKNATVMMIEGADRFGLAQLHQFRGRVGRNSHQSYCFLFTDSQEEKTLLRLKALVECNDGFELAQKDLKYRGAGQIYGYQQSGFSNLKIATLDDLVLAKSAQEAADFFINNYNINDFPELSAKLKGLNFSQHLE
ncbi:MAG: ATP-dependent DNA helicase RecG [Candidatus Buchananbacteria bacterium RIFCSPLOWO2_01_FULL_39_33]|uniref:ATP-dependent DNA helicase RecG n=1 Tax=Candidatus Buchananbacteria bacterium RIFCSPLOWO2_01_FULL_39_33 TaxID=1797543 RepID=A0A1G1YL04_9BACT|nr:MAG: ATP-dependent DNA helicase RecG [Candidatus Buchananbacteria bacterium RIFCSPLOWO2_01_FULL_39_33]